MGVAKIPIISTVYRFFMCQTVAIITKQYQVVQVFPPQANVCLVMKIELYVRAKATEAASLVQSRSHKASANVAPMLTLQVFAVRDSAQFREVS